MVLHFKAIKSSRGGLGMSGTRRKAVAAVVIATVILNVLIFTGVCGLLKYHYITQLSLQSTLVSFARF